MLWQSPLVQFIPTKLYCRLGGAHSRPSYQTIFLQSGPRLSPRLLTPQNIKQSRSAFSTLTRSRPTTPRLFQLSCHLYSPPAHTMASISIPKTMKGVLVEKTGGVEVLEYKTDLPVPEPKEGQILVKNDYIGINYIDTYVHPLPSILLKQSS